jgi:hypothetical protein
MNDNEKIELVSKFHRAALELDWAKHGRAKTANKNFAREQKKLLTLVLGRVPSQVELDYYDRL